MRQQLSHRTSRVVPTAAAALVLGLLAACGADPDTDDGGGDSGGQQPIQLTIGWVNDLTGPLSGLGGIEETNAAQLAVDMINEESDTVELTLQVEDGTSTNPGAVAATQRLLRDGVDVMSGFAFTQAGQAVMPIVAQDGTPTLFVSVSTLTDRPANVFTMNRPNGDLQTFLVEEYLADQGVESLGIIWQEQPTLADNRDKLLAAAEDSGIEVVADQGASLATTDFNSQIASVLAAEPDAVSLDLLAGPAATTLAGLRSAGYEGLIVSQLGVINPVLLETAGDDVEGLVVPTFWVPSVDNDITRTFVDAYAAEYPESPNPNLFGMLAWDSIHVLAAIVEEIGSTDPAEILAAFESGSWETGMNPEFSFGDDGYGDLTSLIVEYQDGVPVPIG